MVFPIVRPSDGGVVCGASLECDSFMKKVKKQDYLELAVFLAHYYSGQGSRGYRLLCKLEAKWSSNFEQEAIQSEVYQYLVANYATRI